MSRLIGPDLQVGTSAKNPAQITSAAANNPSGSQILGRDVFIKYCNSPKQDLAAAPIGHWDFVIGALN